MGFKEFVHTVKSEADDAVEVTKLKTKISKEKTGIKDNFGKIGEIIYTKYAQGGCEDADIAAIITEINDAKGKIDGYNQEINKVKMS